MIIKFFCDKHCQDFERTEEQLMELKPITHCPYCGQKLHIINLHEIVEADVETKINQYLDKMLKELGGDETLSLIERNKNQSCYRLYKEEMIKRGFIIK
jgi:hypothetical protein